MLTDLIAVKYVTFFSPRFLNNQKLSLCCSIVVYSVSIVRRELELEKWFFLKEPVCRKKRERYSIRTRGALLFNKLRSIGIIPANLSLPTKIEILSFGHKIQPYLVHNHELNELNFQS